MVVTIKDLAKKLHVSPATVSLALNDNPAINQETARKVKEAAQSMGYVRNQEFKNWIIQCVSEHRGAATPRKNVSIELIDISEGSPDSVESTPSADGVVWVLSNAWVTKYNGADLNASTSEVAIESVELAYEELTIPN